jgi:hypothetical protein
MGLTFNLLKLISPFKKIKIMALNKTTTSSQGFEAVNAYHRVEKLCLATNQIISFSVRVYKDIAFPAFADNGYSCAYDITGENPVKQAYLHLKTLPEFASATDC